MKSLPIGELKTRFSQAIAEVKSGEEIIVTYGKKRENVAVIIPYSAYKAKNVIKVGLLKDKKLTIADDFKMTDVELLDP